MIEAKFKITYSHGMHARPATMLVSKATSFESKMILEYKNKIRKIKEKVKEEENL